jgi:hypothetical protein
MSDPFSLRVPVDPVYRVLAPEVTGRYVDLLGGGRADREALVSSVTEAIDALVGSTYAGHVDLVFTPTSDGVQVTLRCDGRSSVVRHALVAAKR